VNDDSTIPMAVRAILTDPINDVPVVLLEDTDELIMLPITIGCGDGTAIASELNGIKLARPLPHQLSASLLAGAGGRVDSVVIVDRVNGAFSARVDVCLADGSRFSREARASDALALALHTGAVIRVARHIVEPLRCNVPGAHLDSLSDSLEGLSDEAFGKWKI